eukprot:scaffold9191_cov114-Cylindrotheca_fusiformis.AAC.6
MGEFLESRTDCFRPTINDVERISWGKPARMKGTGSRGVPHRLNVEERLLFDQARRKGFLEVAGSGWRAKRRDSPLLNTYRSLCDARGQVCVVLHKNRTDKDVLVVDISPLRYPTRFSSVAHKCLEQNPGGDLKFETSGSDGAQDFKLEDMLSSWSTRPIYQLPAYCVVWQLPRTKAKLVGKKIASLFDTAERKSSSSQKPIGVKPGRGRRHGGYGIG